MFLWSLSLTDGVRTSPSPAPRAPQQVKLVLDTLSATIYNSFSRSANIHSISKAYCTPVCCTKFRSFVLVCGSSQQFTYYDRFKSNYAQRFALDQTEQPLVPDSDVATANSASPLPCRSPRPQRRVAHLQQKGSRRTPPRHALAGGAAPRGDERGEPKHK